MGAPMAKNLLKSKYQVKVFNRTKKKADKLKNYGAKVCNSLKEVVSVRVLPSKKPIWGFVLPLSIVKVVLILRLRP